MLNALVSYASMFQDKEDEEDEEQKQMMAHLVGGVAKMQEDVSFMRHIMESLDAKSEEEDE